MLQLKAMQVSSVPQKIPSPFTKSLNCTRNCSSSASRALVEAGYVLATAMSIVKGSHAKLYVFQKFSNLLKILNFGIHCPRRMYLINQPIELSIFYHYLV